MKAADWCRVLVGSGLVWCVACAAAEDSEPSDSGGSGNATAGSSTAGGSVATAGGSSVAGASSTAGTPGTGGSGGAPSGTAGSPAGTAGTPAGTAGTPAGAAGGGALAACPSPPAAGSAMDLLIDDLEDKDNGVAKIGGRSGYWYTYLDSFGSTIMPAPDATGVSPLKPGSTDCHGGTSCIIISGKTAEADDAAEIYPYAGVGFDFSNAKKPCVYNASAYSGIKFWARGDVLITVKVNVSATADAKGGGTCTTGCNNGHGLTKLLSSTWTEVDLPFATIKQDPNWGTQVSFDKASLLSVQVQVPSDGAFNVALDDFTFY